MIPPAVSLAIKVWLPTLIAFAGDHRPDVPATQAPSRGGAAVALVAGHMPWPQPRTASIGAADRAVVQ